MLNAAPVQLFAMGFYLPVIRDVPRKDVEISLRFWIDELCKSLNVGCSPVRFYEDQAEMKQAMNDGTINFVVAPAMGLVTHFRPEELVDGVSGYKPESDDLLLVVRSAAAIHSPVDLVGKRIILLDSDELSNVYLATLLMKLGLKPDIAQLATISYERISSKQVYQLFFDKADAALIYRNGYETALELNPQIGKRLQVLESYTFKTHSPYSAFFSSRVPAENRELIIKAALKMGTTARGRQVLQLYHSSEMDRTSTNFLIPYRNLLNEYNTLRKKQRARKI